MAKDNWFWDAYTDWAVEKIPSNGNSKCLYSPIFIRLKAGIDCSSVDEMFEGLDRDDYKIEHHESVYAVCDPHRRPEAYIYVKTSSLKKPNFRGKLSKNFDILDVGAPVDIGDDASDLPSGFTTEHPTAPVVAIIDDGIGFLNKAFQNGKDTRFGACWIQAQERIAKNKNSVLLGKVLQQSDIDDILAVEVLDEAHQYARINDELVDFGAHRSTDFAFSHGTHVLDLAAGAGDANLGQNDFSEVAKWPLLAVQLPSESVADSSGMRLETHMVMGVRWILAQMKAHYKKCDMPPLIINISFGLMAGPKNGTRFSEYQIAKELAHFPKTQVVYAYGNGGQSNMVAVLKSSGETGTHVDWLIQPDNFSSSFVEIMAKNCDDLPKTLEIEITTPDGEGISGPIPLVDRFVDIGGSARLYHVGKRLVDPDENIYRPAHLALAVAPTAAKRIRDTLAVAGAWRIAISGQGAEGQDIILQVQRGDTVTGYKTQSRQSYFATARAWSDAKQDYSAPGVDGTVTYAGTNSAMTTVHNAHELSVRCRIHTVGGAVKDGETAKPAPYTAMGAGWSGGGPTDSSVSEEGNFNSGILASGTLSGSVRPLSGTSAAAPQVTRALAHIAAGNDCVDRTIQRPINSQFQNRIAKKTHIEAGRSRRRQSQ